MIDPSEQFVRFLEAAREFPGGAVCIQTLHRYRLRGIWIKGTDPPVRVRLESCVIGGRRYTTREAIARFVSAQNVGETAIPSAVSPKQRARQSAAARRELENMGL